MARSSASSDRGAEPVRLPPQIAVAARGHLVPAGGAAQRRGIRAVPASMPAPSLVTGAQAPARQAIQLRPRLRPAKLRPRALIIRRIRPDHGRPCPGKRVPPHSRTFRPVPRKRRPHRGSGLRPATSGPLATASPRHHVAARDLRHRGMSLWSHRGSRPAYPYRLISSRDLPPALSDLHATVGLAGPAAALRQGQEHRDLGVAPPDRGPATPGEITPAVVGRPGRPGRSHPLREQRTQVIRV